MKPDKSLALKTAEVSEIFSSIQGEGPYLGSKQIFVRFGRCNMHCHYCDEVDKMKPEAFSNYTLDQLLESINALELEKGEHHSISLTGGEPLLYVNFLKNFLPLLKERGFKTYLETNGTLPRALKEVIRWVDVVAMDLKPASSTGDKNFWAEHKAFLKAALEKEVFVKVVVTPQTTEEEIGKCVELIHQINPHILFILQPETYESKRNQDFTAEVERSFFPIARTALSQVRIIPQMHKIWGVR